MSTTLKLPELFGSLVFNEETMKERLSSASYSTWKQCISDGTALDTLDTLFTTSAIDLDDRSEGFATELSLRKPSTVNYLSTDTVTVQVEIEPIITTQSFSGVKLSVRNIPEGLSAGLAQRTIDVDVTGPQNAVSRLSAAKPRTNSLP